MEEEIVLETPVSIGEITLIPVARITSGAWSRKQGVSYLGRKIPLAVVVVSHAGKRALSVSGEEIAIEPLIEAIPGLAEVLERTTP